MIVLSINKYRVIKQGGKNCNEIDNIGVYYIKNTRSVKVKLTKLKNLKELKKLALSFLSSKTRLLFINLRYIFIKLPVIYHLNPECYIQIKINVSGYIIL